MKVIQKGIEYNKEIQVLKPKLRFPLYAVLKGMMNNDGIMITKRI